MGTYLSVSFFMKPLLTPTLQFPKTSSPCSTPALPALTPSAEQGLLYPCYAFIPPPLHFLHYLPSLFTSSPCSLLLPPLPPIHFLHLTQSLPLTGDVVLDPSYHERRLSPCQKKSCKVLMKLSKLEHFAWSHHIRKIKTFDGSHLSKTFLIVQ